MKTNLSNTVAIIALTFSLSTVSFAQIGNIINKAKDAIDKKKDKKAETKPAENAKTESPATKNNQPESNQSVTQNQIGTFYFSNQPFPADGGTQGAKTSFNSNEFIYGRVVFKSGTLRDSMKVFSKQDAEQIDKNDPPTYQSDALVNKIPFVNYSIFIVKDGKRLNQSILNRTKLSEADLNKTYWDFDILPSPENAKTTWIDYNTPQLASIYSWITPQYFASEGTYQIEVEISHPTKDAWGKLEPEKEKWTTVNGNLQLNFRTSDVSTLQANNEKAKKSFQENVKRQAYENQPAPAEWNAQSNPLIAGVLAAKLQSLWINNFSNRNEISLLKIYAFPAKSRVLWTVQTNDFGIPNYRYSNQWYLGFGKNKVTGKCFFQEFGLRQNYSGGGTYGETFIDYNDESKSIKCDKLGLK